MLKIRLGSKNSTLAKLHTLMVGEALKIKFPDLELEYIFKESHSDLNLLNADTIIGNLSEFDYLSHTPTKVFPVLSRSDQREIIFFKKTAYLKENDQLNILCFDEIHTENTSSFLKEFLPLLMRNREINFVTRNEDLSKIFSEYQSSNFDALAIPKNYIDKLLTALINRTNQDELDTCRELVRQILLDSLFLIPPLSYCPSAPLAGIIGVRILTNSDSINHCLRAIFDTESDFVARQELTLASQKNDVNEKIHASVLVRPYGNIEYGRGKNYCLCRLSDSCSDKFSIHEIWPPNAKMAPRQRERLEYKIPSSSDLYISRGYAFPLDLAPDPSQQIVWAAGLTTWKDLSNRNIWVHGTSDGLGESEPMKLTSIMARKLNFVKLSHMDSETSHNTFPLISTYRLSYPEIPVDFDPSKIKAAFWPSSTEFDILTKRFPELKKVIHFVSPGSTYTKIKSELESDPQLKLHISLSFEVWRTQNILF